MALNEIKVPDWAWRPMERDSWIVLSHVWAGRSVGQEQVSACAGVWLLSGQTFLNTPAKLQTSHSCLTIFYLHPAWERRVNHSPAASLDTS